jgi:hypothetical protein
MTILLTNSTMQPSRDSFSFHAEIQNAEKVNSRQKKINIFTTGQSLLMQQNNSKNL